MTELSLNILDIAYNSIRAEAQKVFIEIMINTLDNMLIISISDNGCGMDEHMLKNVTDPFSTTRSTRKVGMGIPLFKMAAEMSGGKFSIESLQKVGTKITASFMLDHIDRPPLGNIPETMVTLIGASPDTEFVLKYVYNKETYVFDTAGIKEVLDGVDISNIEILSYLKDLIKENIQKINGGNSI